MTVHLLVIDHRHGRHYWAFPTEQAACDRLDAYVQEWWEREMYGRPMPKNPIEATEQYFDCNENEYYDIVTLEVEQ